MQQSRSREGAWIEIAMGIRRGVLQQSRSREGAWIEIISQSIGIISKASRSREGAWIEISEIKNMIDELGVAPARERGLKSDVGGRCSPGICSRSREGAWIEIGQATLSCSGRLSRSREGAWIEMLAFKIFSISVSVAPAR